MLYHGIEFTEFDYLTQDAIGKWEKSFTSWVAMKKLVLLISFFVLTSSMNQGLHALVSEEAYRHLDNLAILSGTDKSSHFHDYTKVYAFYFDSIKDAKLNFMEIGVQRGYSVCLWENYFKNANLHFIDISYQLLSYNPKRAFLHTADQSNPDQLTAVADQIQGGLDIIIDDGGHLMDQQITSFKALFPYLNSGGIYIIEDLHTSYWASCGGGGYPGHPRYSAQSATEFLKTLIDDVNFVGARTGCANHDRDLRGIDSELNEYRKQILSMTFYDSLCVIIKR